MERTGHIDATHAETPFDLVHPPQVPFSCTLRWARARRQVAGQSPSTATSYCVTGEARDADELSTVIAFCKEHHARLELD